MLIKPKTTKAFTLVEIMIVVTVIATLVTIAIPHLLRVRINANEAAAQATLKTISSGCESFATATGRFPNSIQVLLSSKPQYINDNYTNRTIGGYGFSCSDQMDVYGYNCTALPVNCGISGTKTFRIITGGVLNGQDCI
jgi:prepilin-type N-terminal cleavage/methylation domain-containing protein